GDEGSAAWKITEGMMANGDMPPLDESDDVDSTNRVPARLPPSVPDEKLYKHCFDGYQYRDILIPQEFLFMTQVIFFLLTILGAARAIPFEDQWVPRLLV